MAETATPAKSKGIRRFQIGLNVLIQLVLVFFLVSAVYMIAEKAAETLLQQARIKST